MENTVESMKKNYNENLKAVDYNKELNEYYLPSNPEGFEFTLKFFHEIIQSDRFKGSKVLEVGSGATVHNIASASSKFSNIVQSDYVLDNCNELKRWHAGTSTLDWSKFLDIVLKLEGKEEGLERARKELENRIRRSVKCVVRGDLLSDNVLFKEELTPETSPPFDLVISSLCIQVTAQDFDAYVAILKRINKLLRQGGGLIICDFELGEKWSIGDKTFHYIQLTLKQIFEALEKAGFRICASKTLPKPNSDVGYEYKSLFCLAAEKL